MLDIINLTHYKPQLNALAPNNGSTGKKPASHYSVCWQIKGGNYETGSI